MSNVSPTTTRTARRGACDKCHALKVRCERSAESNKCHRCTRLRLDCGYSPSLPLGRPRNTTSGYFPRRRQPRTTQYSCRDVSDEAPSHRLDKEPPASIDSLGTQEQEFPMSPLFTNQSEDVQWPGQSPPSMDQNAMEAQLFGLQTPLTDVTSANDGCWWPTLLEPMDNLHNNPASSSGLHCSDPMSDAASCPTVGLSVGYSQPSSLPESDEQINRLLDLQLKLTTLHRSFVTGPVQVDGTESLRYDTSISKAIEDVYDATQHFVETSKALYGSGEATPAGAHSTSARRHSSLESQARGTAPHVSTLLLLSSCYFRLTHIYALLIHDLHERCNQGRVTPSTSAMPLSPASLPSQSSSASDLSQIPAFRMAHSRLPMPPSASLGMHLVVINHMIKLLKETMRSCVPQSAVSNKTSTTTSMNLAETSESCSPALIAIELAMSELAIQEESLKTVFQIARADAEL